MASTTVRTPKTKKLKEKRPNIFVDIKRKPLLYILALPAVAYTIIFGYMTYPFLVIAFEKYNYKTGLLSEFVGLDNFRYFFDSSWAWIVTRNTIITNLLFIITGTIFSVVLALLINEAVGKRFVRITQSTMLFPYFISWVVVSYILYALISTNTGLINNALESMGFARISFYNESKYWYGIFTILRLWKFGGYTAIIYLAAIAGIDESIYEAADIDGASRFQKVSKITLPLLMPTVSVLTMMSIGVIFASDFDMFYSIVKENGAILDRTEVITTYAYRTFKITGDLGLSTAISLYQSVVGFILVFGSNMLVKKLFPDGSLF